MTTYHNCNITELLNTSQESEDDFGVKCFELCPGRDVMLCIHIHFTLMSAMQNSNNSQYDNEGKVYLPTYD